MPTEGKLMHIHLFPSCKEWRIFDLSIEYYWQLIHRHAKVNCNEEWTNFTWRKDQEDSFQQMKDTFSSNSVFQYQEINQSSQMAAKWCRKRLLVGEKELWVVTWDEVISVLYLREDCTLVTDHCALQWLLKLKRHSAKWLDGIYNFRSFKTKWYIAQESTLLYQMYHLVHLVPTDTVTVILDHESK